MVKWIKGNSKSSGYICRFTIFNLRFLRFNCPSKIVEWQFSSTAAFYFVIFVENNDFWFKFFCFFWGVIAEAEDNDNVFCFYELCSRPKYNNFAGIGFFG